VYTSRNCIAGIGLQCYQPKWRSSWYSNRCSLYEGAITGLDPTRIRRELQSGNIVIVAGFQGITADFDVTTLGRGASDLTAVALAVGLDAARCEIYTDVDGIYTAEPRLVTNATKLTEVGFEEMLELASYGAKMQPRSIELAAAYHMPLQVSSSFTENPGTLIHEGANMEVRNKVRGVAADRNVAKITVLGIPDRPGIAATLFEALANQEISVDTIVQNASEEHIASGLYSVLENKWIKEDTVGILMGVQL